MDGEDRKVPGERLTRRLHERVARRPRLGFAPEFYARHGLDDPWAQPGEPEPEPAAESGMVYLSGAPYRAMMRRLAAARKRRERRTAAFAERRSGTKLRAVSRRWPGEPGVATVSIARLAASDVVLPAPAAARTEAPVEIVEEGQPVRRLDRARAREISGASAWGTAGSATRGGVAAGTPASSLPRALPAAPPTTALSRPMDHVGQRLAPARDAYVEQLSAAVAPSRRRKLARAVEEVELLPEPERRPALARRIKALGAAGPVLREVDPTLTASPRRTRAASPTTRVTAVSSRSPALALASSAETDRAASSTLASAVHQPRPQAPWAPRPSAFGVPAWAAGLASTARAPRPVAAPVAAPPPTSSAVAAAARPTASPRPAGAPPPAPASLTDGVGTEALPAPVARRSAARLATPEVEDEPVWRAPLSARAVARSFGDEVVVGPRAFQPRAVAALRSAYTLAAGELAVPAQAPAPTAVAPDGFDAAPARAATPRASATRAAPLAWATPTDVAAPVAGASRPAPSPGSVTERSPGAPALPRASSLATAAARAVAAPATRLTASPVSRVEALWQAPGSPTPRADRARTAARGPGAALDQGVVTGAPASPATTTGRPTGPVFRRPAGLPETSSLPFAAREAATEPAPTFGTDSPAEGRPAAARPAGPAAWPPPSPAAPAPTPPSLPSPATVVASAPVAADRSRPSPTLQASARADRAWGVPAPLPGGAERAFADLRRALGVAPGAVLLPPTSYAHAFARVAGEPGAAPTVRFLASVAKDAVLASREPATTDTGTPAATAALPTATAAPAEGVTVRTASPLHRLTERAAQPPSAPAARVTGPLAWAGALRPRLDGGASETTSPSSRPADLRRRSARADSRATPARARTLPTAELTPVTPTATPTPEVSAGPEETPRTRSLPWASARADVTRATAYQGAIGDAPPAEPTRASRTGRRPATPELTAVDAPTPDLGRRLHGLAANASPEASSPTWSARADGTPRVRSVNGLFDALARARDTEEVVRVLFLRADGLREAPAEVRAPIQAVVQEIREQVAASDPRPVSVPTETVRPPRTSAPETRTLQQAPVRSSAQRSSGGATRPNAVAWRGATTIHSGDDRVMKLVRKLQDLIHLAEAQHRLSDAQRQVRMAEDSAQARAEAGHGGAKPGAPVGGNEQVDIDALVREVSAAISNELQLRRSRRMEDPDESVWW